jgi:hypothetical protein
VMPPRPVLGRLRLQVQIHRVAGARAVGMDSNRE